MPSFTTRAVSTTCHVLPKCTRERQHAPEVTGVKWDLFMSCAPLSVATGGFGRLLRLQAAADGGKNQKERPQSYVPPRCRRGNGSEMASLRKVSLAARGRSEVAQGCVAFS
ncbi:hypothetical protein MRX96_028562 [Rhipicephalus microplus]